jgi:hypothetical protein
MTVVGPDYYPSAAYISLDKKGTGDKIRIKALGTRPEDGFSCYAAFGDRSRGCRWGDYNGAKIDPQGNFLMEVNWVSDGQRDYYSNWSTWIGEVILR